MNEKGHHFVQKKIEDDEIKKTSVDVKETNENEHNIAAEQKKSFGPARKKSAKEIREKIDSDLTAIYADSEGNIPDMQTFAKRKSHSLVTAFIILALSCVFFGVVLWLGYTVFDDKTQFAEDGVVLSISGEPEITMGKEVTYRIRYRNAQNTELTKSTLEVRYPEGFEFVSSSANSISDKKDKWELGSLKRDESGFIDISGRLYGPLNSEHSFRTFLTYQPANFSSEFKSAAQVTSKITKAPIELEISGPNEVREGKEVTYKILIKIDAEDGQLPSDLRLLMKEGSLFSVSQSDPAARADGGWQIAADRREQEFNLTGSFGMSQGPLSSSTFDVVLTGRNNEKEFTLFEEAYPVSLLPTDVKTVLIVNGKTEPIDLTPGDLINASITFENVSQETLYDAEVQLSIDAPAANKKSIIVWPKLDDVFNGDVVGDQLSGTMRRGTISWNKKHISDLASLDPGKKIIIDVRVPLYSADETDLTAFEAFKGLISVDVKYRKKQTMELVSGTNIDFTINSDAKLDVRSEQKNGVYNITWALTNSFHNLENLKIEADLFGDISFDANAVSAPAGSISYDDSSKRLTWNIKSMPTSVDILALQFDVKLNKENPSQKNLTSRVRGKATDIVTGKEIELIGDEVLLGN